MTNFELAHVRVRRLILTLGILALAVLIAGTNRKGVPNPAERPSLMAAYGAETAAVDRTMRDYKTPEQIEWKPRPGRSSEAAAVFGDPAKPGLYIQLLKRGPDDWSQPHSHPNERFITVLAGTFKIGTGAKFDKDATVSLGPGSVVRDIANQMHYDGTGPEGATIQIMGIGPSTRN